MSPSGRGERRECLRWRPGAAGDQFTQPPTPVGPRLQASDLIFLFSFPWLRGLQMGSSGLVGEGLRWAVGAGDQGPHLSPASPSGSTKGSVSPQAHAEDRRRAQAPCNNSNSLARKRGTGRWGCPSQGGQGPWPVTHSRAPSASSRRCSRNTAIPTDGPSSNWITDSSSRKQPSVSAGHTCGERVAWRLWARV